MRDLRPAKGRTNFVCRVDQNPEFMCAECLEQLERDMELNGINMPFNMQDFHVPFYWIDKICPHTDSGKTIVRSYYSRPELCPKKMITDNSESLDKPELEKPLQKSAESI
jgi:hypothetical protein